MKMESDFLKMLNTQINFCFEKNRKATFTSWVFNDEVKCSAAKLAEAGFIFVGNDTEIDAVKCFLCEKTLDCWEEDDDPWCEHVKHSTKCEFAKTLTPEKGLTLSKFVQIRNEVIIKCYEKFLRQREEAVDKEFDKYIEMLLSNSV